MSSNYRINIDTGERHEDYVRCIFRDILEGPNSTLDFFIERNKDDWETGKEVQEIWLIKNDTEKCNKMVSSK